MDPSKSRHMGNRTMLAVVAIAAAVGGILATMVAFGIVHDLGTVGSLFSVMAVPIAVAIFCAARLLHQGIRRTRLAALLDEDRRDREHVVATVSLCQHLAVGASKRGTTIAATRISSMRHIATHIVSIRSRYSHHLSTEGQKIVECVCDTSFNALNAGSCARANFADIDLLLSRVGAELLPLYDPQLEARRRRAAGIEDPPPD